MSLQFISLLVVLLGVSSQALSNGYQVYQQVCASCHSANFPGCPQMGDKTKWAPLIAEGQVVITAHGYVGVRGMPAKGGKADLTLEDFSLALNYMVNKSGGHWQTPNQKMIQDIHNEILIRQKNIKK